MKLDKFFNQQVPRFLKKLKADAKPEWGSMTAVEMINHLRQGIALSIDDSEREVKTPPDKLGGMKEFLMSDKPFPPNRKKPAEYDQYKFSDSEFLNQKIEFLRDIIALQVHFNKYPDFTSVHPSFGVLNKEEWMHLHHKHFQHHFQQFNLMRK